MEVEEQLQWILSYVNRWLEFAEKKNATLLAGNTGLILGVLSLLQRVSPADPINPYLELYIYVALVLVAVAAACCLVSFLPQTRMPWLASRRRTGEDDNLLLFGDLADHSPSRVLSALCRRVGENEAGLTRLHNDYAGQIVVNSRIADRKYKYFTVALWLTSAALVTPLGAGIVYLLLVRDRS